MSGTTKQNIMKITNSTEAYNAVKDLYNGVDDREECRVALLNGASDVIDIELITIGTISTTLFDIRRIVKACLLKNATGAIVYHNHPSNDCTPSDADIKSTESLREACDLFDISLCDHIIIGNNQFFSFSDEKTHKNVA